MPIRHVILSNDDPNDEPAEVVRKWLSIGRYADIGSGCFASVYRHPLYDDKVIKILRFQDRGYTAFVRATLRLQDKGKPCPWLPRIYEAILFHVRDSYGAHGSARRLWPKVLVVVLDKLVGYKFSEDGSSKLNDEQNKLFQSLLRDRIYGVGKDTLIQRFGYLAPCKQLKRQLKRAENAIRWAIRKSGATCDLHHGNVMFKPDSGQLVITDPIA